MKIIFLTIFILIAGQFLIFAQERPPIFNPSKVNSSISKKPPITTPAPPPPENPPIHPPGIPTGAPSPPPSPAPSPLIQNQNTLEAIFKNIPNAIETAKKVLTYSKRGKIWIHTAPMGEKEIKAGIVYNNVIIGVIRFSAFNGEILPEGFNERYFQINININSLYTKFKQIKKELKVVEGVEYIDPESCFAIPVVYNGKIVFKIKVYSDGIHVIPDYPAMEEIK